MFGKKKAPRPIERSYAMGFVTQLEDEFRVKFTAYDYELYIMLIQQGPYAEAAYEELREIFLEQRQDRIEEEKEYIEEGVWVCA